MDIREDLAARAFEEACAKFPEFAGCRAALRAKPIYQGVAYVIEWEGQPPEGGNAWEFQNAVVKAYKRMAGA